MKEQNLKLQIRILLEQNIAFGPGKADLLEAIERTGSISQAAKIYEYELPPCMAVSRHHESVL